MHNAEHICRICSSLFKTEYLKHKSRTHSVPYLCSTCGKSFTRHSSLIEHNKQHSDKKETCSFEKCGKMLLLSFLVIVVSITFAYLFFFVVVWMKVKSRVTTVKVTSKIKSQFLKEQRRSKKNGDKNNQ